MSRKKVDLILENVLIESVAAEGKAIAHVDGMVLFVEFAVPGLRKDLSHSAPISASAAAANGSLSLMTCS